ncbi:hypothetical protein RFI_06206 [Reticulomyxa filosa]|uniref:Uncharacterized protein n=1 Tax=Reticulomyxa filosa TaxID=46433 RepID=X6NX88_RETFI|nr:hypothetical protein RFI_06206 [Reticulomyxa filosa]|eukprot:ETO30915.1 hypothetical protein RFI_06206 [Reticulomyxa filosa]
MFIIISTWNYKKIITTMRGSIVTTKFLNVNVRISLFFLWGTFFTKIFLLVINHSIYTPFFWNYHKWEKYLIPKVRKKMKNHIGELNLTTWTKLQLVFKVKILQSRLDEERDLQKERHDTTISTSDKNTTATAEYPHWTKSQKVIPPHNHRLANFDNGTPVNSNDVNQQSTICQVQDRTRTHYDYTYYSACDYVIGNRIELTNNEKGVFLKTYVYIMYMYVYIMYIYTCLFSTFNLLSVIKYIGKDDWFVIELDEFDMKNHNDSNYFTTKEEHGLFVIKEIIVKQLENGSHNEEVFFALRAVSCLKTKPWVSLSFFF